MSLDGHDCLCPVMNNPPCSHCTDCKECSEERDENEHTERRRSLMTNIDFRENDVAKLEGKVLRLNDERTAAYLDVIGKRYWVEVDDLELVDRPGPRLEDLPHGTVIRKSDANAAILYVVCGNHQLHSLIGHTTTFEKIQFPIEILGACPATPAWEPWLKAFNHADGDPDYIGEWWRSE